MYTRPERPVNVEHILTKRCLAAEAKSMTVATAGFQKCEREVVELAFRGPKENNEKFGLEGPGGLRPPITVVSRAHSSNSR